MSGNKIDQGKGRVKEAVGSLTDDDRLKREGKIDQATATVKDAVDKAREKIGKAADKASRED